MTTTTTMPEFSSHSKRELATCHPHLRRVAEEAIRYVDYRVLEGYRSEQAQNRAYRTGRSTLQYPGSKHNRTATEADVRQGFAGQAGEPLSWAVDVAIYHYDDPHIRWGLRGEFYMLGGLFRGIGAMILPSGWGIRLGADWDSDGYTSDQSFHDLPHVELVQTD